MKSLIGLLCLVVLSACASNPKERVMQSLDFESLSRQAVKAVENETNVDLSQVSWEFADRYRLGRLMYKSAHKEYKRTISDSYYARYLSTAVAYVSAENVLGLYKHNLKKVFISPDNMERAYPTKLNDRNIARELYLALFIHEYVHAADYLKMLDVSNNDSYVPGKSEVLHTLMEGHAEYLSEKICKKVNCSKGYEALISGSGKKRKFKSKKEKYLTRLYYADLKFAYKTGKRYVAKLYRKSDESPIPQTRDELPDSAMLIWYPDNQKLRESLHTSAKELMDSLGRLQELFPIDQFIHHAEIFSPPRALATVKQITGTIIGKEQKPLFYQASVLRLKKINADRSYQLTDSDTSGIIILLDMGSTESSQEFYQKVRGEWNERGAIFTHQIPLGGNPEKNYQGSIYRVKSYKARTVIQFDRYLFLSLTDTSDIQVKDLERVPEYLLAYFHQ